MQSVILKKNQGQSPGFFQQLRCLESNKSEDRALDAVVRFHFQLTTIHSLAAQRPAEFSNAFFQNVLQRRSASESADHDISANSGACKKIASPRDRPCVDGK